MKRVATDIAGVYILECFHASDDRGVFVKTFHAPTLHEFGLETHFEESFFSVNHTGVIRGMHFQLPPHNHVKIVYCNQGALNDVVLDLRKDSPTYGKSICVELSDENRYALYIPSGMAHGFETLVDNTIMTYLTSTPHAPSHDAGIRWDSFGHTWKLPAPVLSARDQEFQRFDDFETPFTL